MSLALLLALLASPAPTSMNEAVERTSMLVEETLKAGADLAVEVELQSGLENLEALVIGSLSHRLERVPVVAGRVTILAREGTPSETRARASGAEWLLRLTVSKEGRKQLSLQAELWEVDRGFWWPETRPRVVATLRSRIQVDDGLLAWIRAEDAPAVGAGLSVPRPWLELDEAVLDIAGCDLDRSSPGDELLVLMRERLRVYRVTAGGLVAWITYAIEGAPPAMKLRVPRGRVLCDAREARGAKLWLGSSDFALGARLGFDPARNALFEEQRLPGIPLAVQPDGGVELAVPDPDSGGFRLLRDGRIVLDLLNAGGGPLVLLSPGRFHRRESNEAQSSPLAEGGLGGSARADLETGWVTTSSISWTGPDQLTLRGDDGQPVAKSVSVPGPVRATGFLRGDSGEIVLVAAIATAFAKRTTLMRLTVGAEAGRKP